MTKCLIIETGVNRIDLCLLLGPVSMWTNQINDNYDDNSAYHQSSIFNIFVHLVYPVCHLMVN